MAFLDILVGLVSLLSFVVAPFVAFKVLRNDRGSLGGPRDIRASKPLGERLIEAGVDWLSPVGNPMASLETVFGAGRKDPRFSGETAVFKTKLGWRIGIFPAVIFLLWITYTTIVAGDRMTSMDWLAVMAVTALSIWLPFYVLTFRVEVLGGELRSMGMFLNFQTYDLARLQSADDHGDSYALRFDCGSRVSIPHFIEGHDTLKKIVIHALQVNGR